MHTARTLGDFKKLANIFKEKYKDQHPEFTEYFDREWVSAHPNWFLGTSNFSPSTNNACKSFNGKLKQNYSLRRRLPLKEFCVEIFSWVPSWSRKYVSQKRVFHEQIDLSTKLWRTAVQFASKIKVIRKKQSSAQSQENTFIVPAGDRFCIAYHDRNNYKTFHEYSNKAINNYFLVTLPKNKDFLKGTCDCPCFYKRYMCKHVLAVALRHKYVKPPASACSIRIEAKRGPGRPTKTKKALQKQ